MDRAQIKKTAEDLATFLAKYATTDQDAALLQSSLSKLINVARNGKINVPLELGAVPGVYFFTERELRKYDALDRAYAEFKIAVTGGETPVLRELRLTIGRLKLTPGPTMRQIPNSELREKLLPGLEAGRKKSTRQIQRLRCNSRLATIQFSGRYSGL
jgi:hypothetical protein